MKQKIINIIGILFLVAGIVSLLYPEIMSYLKKKQSDQTVKELTQESSQTKQSDPLYQKAVRYNRKIFQEKQTGLKDVFSYRSAPIILKNEKNTFGYIKIPKMKQKLPLYLGATMENMRKGAAIMGQTSLPLGQKDSNCVIAAHRGYEGIPYFREIEKLKVGDRVIVKNPWEKLTYRVEEIKIIQPDDSDQIKIRKGKDMVTLLTCHPYRGHGRYRYVVYCIRDHGQKIAEKKNSTIKDMHFQSSELDIRREKIVRYVGLMLLIFFGIGIIMPKKKR